MSYITKTYLETQFKNFASKLKDIFTTKEDFNDLEIGGRNLLPKAKYGDNIKNISNNSVSGYGYIFSEQSTSPNPIWSSELNLQPGVSYTLSFIAWIDVSDNDAIQALCVDLNPDTLPQKNYDWTNGVTNVPTKFVWTFKSTHSDMLSCRLRFFCDISSTDGYKFKYVPLYITDIKLEEGNKATDWTPAPEDTEEKITELNTKYTEVKQTADTNTSSISSMRTEIGKKADGSTVTELSKKTSKLEQNLDGFKTEVSKTYTTKTEFDNLEIGGRNLQLGSKDWNSTAFYSKGNASISGEELTVPNGSTHTETHVISVKLNEVYTVSFDVKCNTNLSHGGTILIEFFDSSNIRTSASWVSTNLTTEWQRVSQTFTVTDTAAVNMRIGLRSSITSPYTNSYRLLKIEKGNKATDWTPAPEDTEEKITELNTKYTEVKQTADGLSTTVASHTTQLKSVENQVTTNLLKPTLATTTQNGVTCTNNGDGTYTLNGTASAIAMFDVGTYKLDISKQYRLVGVPSNKSFFQFHNGDSVLRAYKNGITFTPNKEEIQFIFFVEQGTTIENEVIKPMLTTNLNATYDDFVPYTGSTGSMNGDLAEVQIALDGKAASSHTHDDRYYTESEIDNKLDSISGIIFNNDISKKDFTYVIYNPDTLRDWIENKSGNDYTSVLIKKGTYSYTITDINNFISVSKQGTLYIEGEEGSKLSIKYEADKNLNYFFIIGCENNSKLDMFPENASIDYVSTDGYKRMSLNNVNIYLYTFAHKNSSEYYIGILKYANGINNCNFKVDLAYGCEQTTACCYYGCTNLNNCKGITVAEYNQTTVTTKTGYNRLRPFYSCSRVINSYAYGRNGYAGGAFYNGDHIINCNAKFENMYYGETFYGVSHVIGCRSYASVGTENGGSACAYKNCKKMLYNYAAAGSYSGSYASGDTNSTYLCANTLNGGWNS